MDTVAGVRALLERRLADIREEVERLERASAALSGSDRGSRARSGSRRKGIRKPAATQVKRAAHGQRRAEVLDAIRKEPGIRVSQIAARMAVKPAQVHAVARQLEKDGEVKKNGAEYTATPKRPSAAKKRTNAS